MTNSTHITVPTENEMCAELQGMFHNNLVVHYDSELKKFIGKVYYTLNRYYELDLIKLEESREVQFFTNYLKIPPITMAMLGNFYLNILKEE